MAKVIAYHGSKSVITRFEIQKQSGNDQYGPGIYLTDNPKTAQTYGNILHVCTLDTLRFINSKTRVNKSLVESILNKSATQEVLDNFGYTKREFIDFWKRNIIPYNDYPEILQYIWKDVFNLDNRKFCATMVQNGIEGFVIPIQTKENFYICFTPSVIKIDSTIKL